MDLNRVRIDAALHPVYPKGPSPIHTLQLRFGRGDYDHMDVGQVSSAIGRAALLDMAVFNTELNRMLKQYGLWVTNVSDAEPEYALEYLDGKYRIRHCLGEAVAMRDWFLPAASAYHQVDHGHLQGVEELLEGGVSLASV